MNSHRFFTLRKIALGGGILLGLASLTTLGFSSWTFIASSEEQALDVSVGSDGLWRFNLDDQVINWSFSYPKEFNYAYGFYNSETCAYSTTCNFVVSFRLLIQNDTATNTNDYYDYYVRNLNNAETLSFYSRFQKTVVDGSLIDFSTPVAATVRYSANNTNAVSVGSVVSSTYSDAGTYYVDNTISIPLPASTVIYSFDTWTSIDFTLTYTFDFSTYITNDKTNTTQFQSIYDEIVAQTFTTTLFLGEGDDYVSLS